MKNQIFATFALAAFGLLASGHVKAKANEGVCAGQVGAAFGLCISYYEALDCPNVESPACEVIADNYNEITGLDIGNLGCPCFAGVTSAVYSTTEYQSYDYCANTGNQEEFRLIVYVFGPNSILLSGSPVCGKYTCRDINLETRDLTENEYAACLNQYPPNAGS
jgi:hypothetical protein